MKTISLHRLLYFLALATLAVGVAQAATNGLVNAKSGPARGVIVLSDDASPGEQYAAKELQEHLRLITGVTLPQMPEGQYSAARGPCFSIGRTAISGKYVTDAQVAAFGNDGYSVFRRNGNAFFVGGRRRGEGQSRLSETCPPGVSRSSVGWHHDQPEAEREPDGQGTVTGAGR